MTAKNKQRQELVQRQVRAEDRRLLCCGLVGRVERNFEAVKGLVADGEADFTEFEGGVVEDGFVETLHVVEEVAGNGGVGGDGSGLEAEVFVVVEDFLVDVLFADGDGDGQAKGETGSGGGFNGEEAALEVVVGGGGEDGVVGSDEVDAGVVKGEGELGVVGDDDADGEHVVAEVVEAGVGAGLFDVAGFGGDGDVFELVLVVHGVLLRGEGRDGLAGFFCGERGSQEERERGGRGEKDARAEHGWIILLRMLDGQKRAGECTW